LIGLLHVFIGLLRKASCQSIRVLVQRWLMWKLVSVELLSIVPQPNYG